MEAFVYTAQDTDVAIRGGFGWRFEWDSNLGAGASTLLGFTVAERGAIMLDRLFATDGDDVLFQLFRETPWTGGTTWTPYNRNDRYWGDQARRATDAAGIGVTATPLAANTMGTVRLHTTGPKVATFSGGGVAIVLKPGGSYVVRVTNSSVGAADISFSALVLQDRVSSRLFDWRV